MKLLIGLTISLTLAAGSAAAQGTFSKPRSTFGAWAPSTAPKAPASPGYGLPAAPGAAPASRPKSAMAPEPAASRAFKPYEPWKPTPPASVFGPEGKRKR